MATIARAQKDIKALALSLPEAWEDHPWGDEVVKVRKKVFAFLGTSPRSFGLGVKLDRSLAYGLTRTFVKPMGYGLGRAGWVGIQIEKGDVPLDLLRDWVLESYELVAPKKLAAVAGTKEPASAEATPRPRKGQQAKGSRTTGGRAWNSDRKGRK